MNSFFQVLEDILYIIGQVGIYALLIIFTLAMLIPFYLAFYYSPLH